MPVRVGSSLPNFPARGGVCKKEKRAVLQTVALGGFAGSSPATPVRPFHFGRSSKAERRAVTAEVTGSNPAGQPISGCGALAKQGLRHATLYRARAGSNPARPANFQGTVAERLGTGLSDDMAST
jgi:hypothetical protein